MGKKAADKIQHNNSTKKLVNKEIEVVDDNDTLQNTQPTQRKRKTYCNT